MRGVRFPLAGALLAAALGACGERPSSTGAARRIASTLPGLTETVAFLGARDRLVAVSPHCDRPASVTGLARVSVFPLNVETFAAAAPDLVLVDGTLMASSLWSLRRFLPRLLVLESRSLGDVANGVRRLAEVLDTDLARERAAAFERRLQEALRAVAPASGEPPARVLLVAQFQPLYVLGPGSLLDDMVRACGARNVAADLGRASGPFSEELVLERQPDWILTTGPPLPATHRARWAGVPAVARGGVASAASDDLVRAGPRTPDALRRLGDVLAGRRPAADLGRAP